MSMRYSVVIPTYNRASDLEQTLVSLGGLRPSGEWEVIVVDNNSPDATRRVVENARTNFPAPLRYLFEGEQGRSAALNAGISAARGEIIATTDDDVRVGADWLDVSAGALEQLGCEYVGGRVLPLWGGPLPEWLPNRPGKHWAVLALLDHGADARPFGEHVPLGVNMAFRREAFERAGMWNNRIGRKAGTLLGQEVREWMMRARVAGLIGFYAPGMVVSHVVPAARLTKRYFRSWFYWHGVSRALLYRETGANMENPEDTGIDFTTVPHIAGIPRYMYRTAFKAAMNCFLAGVRRDPIAHFEYELWGWFFAGVARQRWADRTPRGVLSMADR
jgi:glycosyltransferase involved in cell wall biosynthesis